MHAEQLPAALAIVAATEGLAPSVLYVDALIPDRPAVFHGMPDGTTRSVCALDSDFWRASVAAASAIRDARAEQLPPRPER